MKLEFPRWMSTSPWVELFLPITTLLCLTRYSNSFPDILAMGVLEIWWFPFTGLGGAMVASFNARRAQASAWASYLIFCWGLGASVAMLSDQCRVRAYTDWPVHPVFVLCCALSSPEESQQFSWRHHQLGQPARRSDRHRGAAERTTCPIINMLSCSIKWLQSPIFYTSCCSDEKELKFTGQNIFFFTVSARYLIYFGQMKKLNLLSLSYYCSLVTAGRGLKLKLNCWRQL